MRYARLGLHLLWGALTIATVYRFLDDTARLWLKQRWSRQLLEILAIRLDTNLHGVTRGSLIVANHISWLDIFVLNAARPMAFVSKSEVREWPLAGWLAANTETLFLRRGRRADAVEINVRIEAMLASGRDVAVFPEGTTTDGSHLRPFHGALLQPAIDSERPVQPLALAYFDSSGQRSTAPAYAGETTMAECIAEIIACRSLRVRLRPTPPIFAGRVDYAEGLTRREVAAMAHGAVAYHLGLSAETDDIEPPCGESHGDETYALQSAANDT